MSNVNIDGGQRLSQIVTAMTTHRGYVNAPVVSLSSAYPLGLLYSWCRPVLFRCQSLVYPAPIKIRPLVVTPRQHRHSLGSNLQQEGDDFSGLRDWHRGDSTKHVHWKSAARGHGLYTKEFAGEAADDVWLAWDTLQGMEHEQRIGQLCQWVLEAEERNLRYGLQLPGEDITVDSGPTHRHHCLKALALL